MYSSRQRRQYRAMALFFTFASLSTAKNISTISIPPSGSASLTHTILPLDVITSFVASFRPRDAVLQLMPSLVQLRLFDRSKLSSDSSTFASSLRFKRRFGTSLWDVLQLDITRDVRSGSYLDFERRTASFGRRQNRRKLLNFRSLCPLSADSERSTAS